MRAVIIDGYVDEPATLGVPPYVSPYIRYTAAVLIYLNIDTDYYTIDQIRKKDLWESFDNYDYLIIIAGTTVPGHYLGGTPISLTEIKRIFEKNKKPIRILGGPITRGYTLKGASKALKVILEDLDYMIFGDVERFLYELITNNEVNPYAKSDYDFIDSIISYGSEVLKKHPRFPDLMIEIDVSRGCERTDGFCSFCTEPLIHGKYRERKLESIVEEVKSISKIGVKNFRFGRAANFLAYGSLQNFNKPNPDIFEELYSEVKKYAKILHTDNANPHYIAKFPKETERIISTIVKYNNVGDILSFGVESFDDKVRKLNKISGSLDDVLFAIELVNEIGGIRNEDGVPRLLPGINILYGLLGESDETYKINRRYLEMIYEKGLLLRRINVRQVMIFPNTMLYRKIEEGQKIKIDKRKFNQFKNFMKEYDNKMLKRVFPTGTVLRDVIIEKVKGNVSFGRQIASYPLLVGIPEKRRLYEKIDVIIVDHGSRSVTAIPYPADINRVSVNTLESIPGIGKALARKIIFSKPIRDLKELDVPENIKSLLEKIFIIGKEG